MTRVSIMYIRLIYLYVFYTSVLRYLDAGNTTLLGLGVWRSFTLRYKQGVTEIL